MNLLNFSIGLFAEADQSTLTRGPVATDADTPEASVECELFGLIQLEQVAERIVQESLVPGAGDERDPVHFDASLLQVGDGGIDVVDSDREVVPAGRLIVGLHQVHLLAAGVEPVARAEIGGAAASCQGRRDKTRDPAAHRPRRWRRGVHRLASSFNSASHPTAMTA
jgi:hypothetical protein